MSSAHSAPPPPPFSPSAWARDAARFPGTQLLGGAGVGGWRPGPSSPCPPAAPPGSGPVPLSGTLLPPSALPATGSCGAASRALPSLCTAPPLGPAAPPKEPPLPAPSSPCSGHGLPVPPPCFAGPTAAQAFPGGLPPDAGTAGPSTARLSPSRATPLCPSENGRPPLREPRSPSCFSPTLPPANTARRSLTRPFPVFLPPPARGPQEGGPPCSSPRSLAAYSAA